ncbi:MAG: hypothetical protein BMS9Abin04_045 [Planctomycetia bacterium]|nr:MAG: hypothetical protein BMS9Abin04_045 [Planctomycetia bacterium]
MDADGIYSRYQELQRYVGWNDADKARVGAAGRIISPHFPALADDFYDQIRCHPGARRVLDGSAEQMIRLKGTLCDWLMQLFSCCYDRTYVAHRWTVGRRHVEVGLDPHYINVALARLQNAMLQVLSDDWEGSAPDLFLTVQSLNKLLSLDLAVIEEAYQTEHVLLAKRSERARSEDTVRNLLEVAGCMIVILRANRTIAYFSPFAEQLTGYRARDVLDRDYAEQIVPQGERRRAGEVIRQVLENDSVDNYQNAIVCRDGSRRTMLWNARRLDRYEEQPVVLAVGQDITPLERAQAKALQSQRLATIGQMSTGLAHESRNALQRIQASTELLELEVGGGGEALELVRSIQNAQKHLSQLLDEVRGYAGPIRLDCTEVRLSGLWRDAWDMLQSLCKDRQAILCEEIEVEDLYCTADHFRMVQVFRNLLENSLDACSDPVRIVIRCRPADLAGRPALRVTVRDNGPGLNVEQKKRIFEPFYTTKSKGTGLGMAIAQRTVEAHGGTIAVSPSAEGAEIELVLPR